MFGFLFNAPAWQLVAQADIMTKFVLLALFILSVFCLSIALSKTLNFCRDKKAMGTLQIRLKYKEKTVLNKQYT